MVEIYKERWDFILMADLKHIKIFEDFMASVPELNQHILDMFSSLQSFNKIVLLTTSNRWLGDKETPKSSMVAEYLKSKFQNVTLINVAQLNLAMCEGNVSRSSGNNCGVKEALLKSTEKNPSNQHRCWASLNNPDDELWKITKELLDADCVIFFASVRWGQANAVYQKLIERLTWLENRHSTLNEENILNKITTGLVVIGQNWNGANILRTQREVLKFFGFNTSVDQLFWNWQYTQDMFDESAESYKDAADEFKNDISKL